MFNRADGQVYESFDEAEIGAAVPLRPERIQAVMRFLLSQRWVEGTMPVGVSLTAAGIAALEEPPARTSTFGNVTFTGPATGVTFGDNSPINIATLTVGDLLKGLEREIEQRVKDPSRARRG